MSDRLHRVGSVEDFPEGGSRRVCVGKWEIAVFNLGGTLYAVKDQCPHQEVSLSTGTVEGTVLTCPGHVWKFDLRDGHCVDGDLDVHAKTFPITVDNGGVFVEV